MQTPSEKASMTARQRSSQSLDARRPTSPTCTCCNSMQRNIIIEFPISWRVERRPGGPTRGFPWAGQTNRAPGASRHGDESTAKPIDDVRDHDVAIGFEIQLVEEFVVHLEVDDGTGGLREGDGGGAVDEAILARDGHEGGDLQQGGRCAQ